MIKHFFNSSPYSLRLACLLCLAGLAGTLTTSGLQAQTGAWLKKEGQAFEALPPMTGPSFGTPGNFEKQPAGTLSSMPAMRGPILSDDSKGIKAKSAAPGPDAAYDAFDRGAYLTALALAKKSADQGNVYANTLIAKIYEEGLGVKQNFPLALQFYKKAVTGGDPDAKFALAVMFATGRGIKQNKKLAADLFEQLAKAGHSTAQYNYALMLIDGQVRPQNYKEAARWLEAAAKQDNINAQYDLGILYLTGVASQIARDDVKAAFWIGKAAQNGHVDAMTDYAVMLFKGKGVMKDEKIGFQYFKAAAAKGNPVAQNRLARLYAYGIGTDRDLKKAAKWHFIARSNGISDMRLDLLVSGMPQKQRLQALSSAAIWQEQHIN